MAILLLHINAALALTLRTIPLPPLEQSHSRIQHSNNPTCDQAHADGTIRVAVEGLPRVIRIAFNPDMIEGDDLRRSWAGLARDDLITGKTDNPFDSYMRWVCRGSRRIKFANVISFLFPPPPHHLLASSLTEKSPPFPVPTVVLVAMANSTPKATCVPTPYHCGCASPHSPRSGTASSMAPGPTSPEIHVRRKTAQWAKRAPGTG